jgi:hypothetical protein
MQPRTRNVWLAGLGVAAVAAAWAILRPRSADRDAEDEERLAESSIGQPPRLVGLARPRPRLRIPRLYRG